MVKYKGEKVKLLFEDKEFANIMQPSTQREIWIPKHKLKR
jgi:hypothetical protein